MFPGAGAQVYYNEAGEPIGWDYPSYYDPDDFYNDFDELDADRELNDADLDDEEVIDDE
jgi:hypothetical protein